MDTSKPQKIVLLVLLLLLMAGWALVIAMAVTVSQNLIGTLQYIVDLAQLAP